MNYEWPTTPDVAPVVLARVPPRPRRWPLVALVAGALLVPTGAVAAPTRDVPTPIPDGPVSLAEAKRIAGFAPVLPPALGTPDQVRARSERIELRYGDLRLYELRGVLGPDLIEKSIQEPGDVRRVPGGAYFPRRHFFAYLRPDGQIESGRTSAPTLLVERGDLLLRLEGRGLTYERARRLLAP